MSQIKLFRIDGGATLLPTVTWMGVQQKKNGVTTISTLTGKATKFTLNPYLTKLRNEVTNWGVYKEHSLDQGAPGIYDHVSITFQALIDSPVYLYDFDSPVTSVPMQDHPSYKTFWDHDLVGKGRQELTAAQFNTYQAIGDGSLPSNPDPRMWQKAMQGRPVNNVCAVLSTSESTSNVTSGHADGRAFKKGITTYKVPGVSIRETIYFKEEPNYTFSFLGVDFTVPNINTKTIASMAGKAGWPLKTTFGYPHDVYSLLNNPTIKVGGVSFSTDYTDYRHMGVTAAGAPVSVTAAFYSDKGIRTDDYIKAANYPPLGAKASYYKGSTFGHPLWFCSSCKIKKIGDWYEATLVWNYYPLGVDAQLYPLATARVLGLA